jgi:hypothetical protein
VYHQFALYRKIQPPSAGGTAETQLARAQLELTCGKRPYIPRNNAIEVRLNPHCDLYIFFGFQKEYPKQSFLFPFKLFSFFLG